MPLNDRVVTRPGAGRTVTYGHGSSSELRLVGEQSGGDWSVVEQRVRPGDEARLLVTLEPASVEYSRRPPA